MDLSIADQYYLKAQNYYPYNIEFVVENLNYAISYDDEHVQALCLKGKVYMYQMKQYKLAISSFECALSADLTYPETYKHYSLLKIWLSDLDSANRLISYGLKIPGMDRCRLMMHRSIIYECRRDYAMAQKVLNEALLVGIDNYALDEVREMLSRVKKKIKACKTK